MVVPALQLQLQTAHALAAAVETVMNPFATNEERQEAHKICEDFKDNSKIGVQYGLKLAEKENSAVVRHFGLQLIEHCIKYRWNDITDSDKDNLKMNSLRLMDQGTHDMLEEAQHIKDGVSRIVVELMKRVWPQLWDSLFTDFTLLCQSGETQTELVLLTLLRFTEDAVCFKNMPFTRLRDVRAALTSAMASIFSFLMYILKKHLEIYRTQTGVTAEKSCKICQSVLDTFTAFVDWVMTIHITESRIIHFMCSLLTDKELCLRASECLLLIVGRKGRPSDRKPLMVLFDEEPMTVLLQAANNATEHITESNNFIFLKRLCEILFETGKQLCTLWGSTEDTGQPPNFEMYLKALLAFTQHPSQSLRHMIYSIWMVFLRHPLASKDPVFQSIIPNLIQSGTVCLHKVGYPSQNNSVSCEYSRLEFDSDEEFNVVLSNLRVIVVETIRLMSLMFPKLTFSVASAWLLENLSKPIEIGPGAGKNVEKGICNLSSPSFIAWDACSVFLEAVMSKVFLADGEQPNIQEGIDLLYKTLDYEMQDPLILSAVLSCISALFPFLNHSPETVPRVLTKIFGAVVFNLPGQTKSKRSQAVKNVRVHACSVLVKVCKNYPDLFLPEFNHLYDCMNQLDTDPDQLSQMEKIILIEALLVVSNQFHDFNRQSSFIEEIILPVKRLWSSDDFVKAFRSPDCFMSYVGLDQAAVEPSSADTCGINRSHILNCINTTLAIIKRSQCPSEFSVAKAGGFIIEDASGNVIRNPAASHVMPLLDNLVSLLKTATCLFKSEYMSLRHNDFIKAYDIMEHDRLSILGIPPACVDNSDSLVYRHPLERMQNFITAVFEYGYHILGNCCICLGREFYNMPGLAKGIKENLLDYLKLLPDFRQRIFIRNFIKPFIQNCPKEHYQTAVIPVLIDLCPQVFQRLTERWHQINQRLEEMSKNDDEEDPESQEVLEMQVVRQLTKEYLELLVLILMGKAPNTDINLKEEQAMEEGDPPHKQWLQGNSVWKDLSDLGMAVTAATELYPCIILCILKGFSWADSYVCHRCTLLILPLCKQLIANNQLSSDAVQHVFVTFLSGLQMHGHTESCQSNIISLGISFYETF
ncbi:cilia- and flagella-associated protein 36-like, partial [Plakobranchus ocellatus]